MPKAAPPNTPFSTPLSGSAREAEDRIRNIFQYQKKRPPALLLALACVLVLTCGGLVSCERQASSASLSPDEEALLRALLAGDAPAAGNLDLLADSVNEKLFDLVGDVVVEFGEDGRPGLVEDYVDDVRDALEKR